MHVVVVESPAKARTLGSWLGIDYTVIASYGHVSDLPAKDGSVLPERDFQMVYRTAPRAGRIMGTIRTALAGAESLVLATDPDREGEAIAWQVLTWLRERDAIGDRPVRRERSVPLVAELEDWMRTERAALSRHAAVAKAMDYTLKRWDGFARFLDDGHICLTNNAAERALRPLCLGRRSWLFAGSDRGGVRAAVMYTLIGTAKLNDVDPQAWLADALDRIADLPQTRLHELLPWNWKGEQQQALAA